MIIYQDTFSVEDCNQHPEYMYIFGDNCLEYGKKGQAVIRDCPNAYGLATKIAPSMKEGSFFSDRSSEKHDTATRIGWLTYWFAHSKYEAMILPSSGLGTGLAQLDKRSPKILSMINKVFYNESTNRS